MDILPTLAEGSIASIVTDPPYHLTGATRFGETRSTRGFMNKEWDGGDIAFRPETWDAARRVIRPGGYLLAFGGTRTYHRLACAIEDGGWEIVDCIQWLYGQGFPKHRSKLKPAVELICMAKAPGPVRDLSIDECRIHVEDDAYAKNASGDRGHSGTRGHGEVTDIRAGGGSAHKGGRWPANVCLDESAAQQLDAQSGVLSSGANPTRRNADKFRDVYGEFVGQESCEPARGADAGGASRFFYCAKASRSERDAGLEGLEKQRFAMSAGAQSAMDRGEEYAGAQSAMDRGEEYAGAQSIGLNRQQLVRNTHPTVKPIARGGGVIPEHLVQQIRDAADIVAIIGEYSPLKRAGSSYRGPCPFHQGKDPNFSVTPGAGYTCFVCGEKGDVFTFVQRRLGLDFVGAVRLVADKAGVAFHEERTDVADPRAPFWEINGAAAEYFAQQLTAHQSALQYLWSRDLTRDHATTYGIGYAPAGGETRAYLASLGFDDARQIAAGLLKAGEDGRPPRCVFRDRLMFSIVDASGNLVGFGGRALGDFKPKYLNTAESTVFSKRNLLYGFQHAKFAARRAERIILVEGHFDAIRLWMAGIDEVVAPLGTMLTPEQAALIKRQVKTAYLLYDADGPG
jgi:DNA primase catalytic core